MNQSQVISLLKSNENQANIEKWNQRYSDRGQLKSFGIGLTVLRKLAKQIGRDRALALELWESDIYDARIIAILIDDPKQITKAQVEMQVNDLRQGHLSHVFSSCGAPLAKTPFVVELLVDWIKSEDTMRKSCGYGLLYEVSKSKTKKVPDDAFFIERIEEIEKTFHKEPNSIQASMGGALMGMGKRSATLNAAALKLAKSIGLIQIDIDGSNCEPFDVAKHLTSDYIKKKLGV